MFNVMPRRTPKPERPLVRKGVSPLELLREEFTPLFERIFGGFPLPFEPYGYEGPWGFETEEKEKEYVVRAELPGFELGEIEVLLNGNLLTIKAEHTEEPLPKGKEPVERPYGKVVRAVTLPIEVMPAEITGTYRNGVLEVHLPKNPAAMPRKIDVKP